MARTFRSSFDEVEAFQLADFAKRCSIDRRLLKREATRLSKLAVEHAAAQALVDDYAADEKAFAAKLRDFVVGQGARLTALASDAARIKDDDLQAPAMPHVRSAPVRSRKSVA